MSEPCKCDREAIFELVERELSCDREGEVKAHLRSCPVCQSLYEREVNLTASLTAWHPGELPLSSVARNVAMALPARSLQARLFWGVTAALLLFLALLALEFQGIGPIALVLGLLGILWGMATGLADVVRLVFVVAGPVVLIALALGAVVDVVIAVAAYLLKRNLSRNRQAQEA